MGKALGKIEQEQEIKRKNSKKIFGKKICKKFQKENKKITWLKTTT